MTSSELSSNSGSEPCDEPHITLVPITTALARGGTASTSAPGYDRSTISAGIAHIGVGNFHRVHQGVYLDDLFATRPDQRHWGVVGIGLREHETSQAKAAAYGAQGQDGLYTVTRYTKDGRRTSRIIGSMIEYLYGPADPAAVVTRLTDPSIRIVSLTITEGGYNLDEHSGAFRLDEPAVAADLHREHPETTFGVLTAALAARRAAGIAPFTVMSCDNLRHNGETARVAVLGFARAVDPDLARWIDDHVAFPNSMVDRIAPSVPTRTRAALNAGTGIDDALPALTEDYRQWILQDDFPTGRPAWEDLGVQLRPDVAAFEAVKGRLLNASHMLLAYPAALAGYRWVAEAAADPAIATVLTRFMAADAAPLLQAPAGVSLEHYQQMVVERFANPHLPDTVLRVAHDGAAKLPVFHRATAEGLLSTGGDLRRVALLLASFRQYTSGVDEHDRTFTVEEPHLSDADWSLLRSGDPLRALEASPFAAWRLGGSPTFVSAYLHVVDLLQAQGVHAALQHAISELPSPQPQGGQPHEARSQREPATTRRLHA
ncbi:mannitol dehydrogenase family protein [Kineococcus glutinatus]|uniref:Mannitol-1-phosphate 5-dehydrogenase n=1 Tax=Kineococcus glutinatus TaxID=1070872 RepID=A0ABP9H9X7_9ACTN